MEPRNISHSEGNPMKIPTPPSPEKYPQSPSWDSEVFDLNTPQQETSSQREEHYDSGEIRPLKTYLTDVQAAIQEQKESLARIALAEKERKEAQIRNKLSHKDHPNQKKTLIILGSVFGITAVLGGAYGAITYFNFDFKFPGTGEPVLDMRPKINQSSLIIPSYEKEIDITNLSYSELVNLIAEEKVQERSAESIENIFFTQKSTNKSSEKKSVKEIVTAQIFFNKFLAGAPNTITRTLSPQFMFGIYNDVSKTGYPFLILKTNSFETAVSGMLAWEKAMSKDLGPLIFMREGDAQGFKDIVIQNKDTRVLLDRVRDPVLVYSFIDRNTILITINRLTFGNIINILNEPAKKEL